MLRSLRIRIVTITMIAITLVVGAISAAVNITNAIALTHRQDNILRIISDFNGTMPENPLELKGKADFEVNHETAFQTRYFVIYLNNSGQLIRSDTDKIASLGNGDIEHFCRLARGKKDGSYGTAGSYRYLVNKTDSGKMITFLDCSQDYETIKRLMKVSATIAAIGLACIFFILIMVSGKIIRPFIENHEKQKRFITDAGHELKTPLAIIRTNAEVLEMCGGKNEWLDSIKNQTERMDTLIQGLLQLSKGSEAAGEAEHIEFSLSAAVNEIAVPFKTLAEQNGHKMHFDIKPDINFKGNAQSIRTLVSILCDNAIKYASEGGEITVGLYRAGKSSLKTARLVVTNDTDADSSEDPNRFFERFYRSESSRSRETGGYGIGLSVAETITREHRGRISASRSGKQISFTVIL